MTMFEHQINKPAIPDQLVTATNAEEDHVSLFTDRKDYVAQPVTLLRIFAGRTAGGPVDVMVDTNSLPQIAGAINAHINYILQADGQAAVVLEEPTA